MVKITEKQLEKFPKIIDKKYKKILKYLEEEEKKSGRKPFDIIQDKDDFSLFYIKFKLENLIYSNMNHVIQIETQYYKSNNLYLFPFNPPKITFKTQIFHPNVSRMSGYICLDILQDKWSSVYNFDQIFYTLIGLIDEPNPTSPLGRDAAKIYKQAQTEYELYCSKNKNISLIDLENKKSIIFKNYIIKNKNFIDGNEEIISQIFK